MARRGRKTTFEFKFDPVKYWTQNLTRGSLSEAQMRQEYTRARAVANKRIKRLQASEFAENSAVKNHAQGFKSLNDIKNTRELIRELSDVHRFLTSRYSSIQGQEALRDSIITSLNDNGYKIINKSNFKAFTDFMDDAKSRVDASRYGSEFLVELFEQSERLRISEKSLLDDVEFWAKHTKKLSTVSKSWIDKKMDREGNQRVSAADLKEMLGDKWK